MKHTYVLRQKYIYIYQEEKDESASEHYISLINTINKKMMMGIVSKKNPPPGAFSGSGKGWICKSKKER